MVFSASRFGCLTDQCQKSLVGKRLLDGMLRDMCRERTPSQHHRRNGGDMGCSLTPRFRTATDSSTTQEMLGYDAIHTAAAVGRRAERSNPALDVFRTEQAHHLQHGLAV